MKERRCNDAWNQRKCGFNYVKDVDVEDLVPKLNNLHIYINL